MRYHFIQRLNRSWNFSIAFELKEVGHEWHGRANNNVSTSYANRADPVTTAKSTVCSFSRKRPPEMLSYVRIKAHFRRTDTVKGKGRLIRTYERVVLLLKAMQSPSGNDSHDSKIDRVFFAKNEPQGYCRMSE